MRAIYVTPSLAVVARGKFNVRFISSDLRKDGDGQRRKTDKDGRRWVKTDQDGRRKTEKTEDGEDGRRRRRKSVYKFTHIPHDNLRRAAGGAAQDPRKHEVNTFFIGR